MNPREYDVHKLFEETLCEDELFEVKSKVCDCLDNCKPKFPLEFTITFRLYKLLADLIEEFYSLVLECFPNNLLIHFFASSKRS